jgi:hypothetical protein
MEKIVPEHKHLIVRAEVHKPPTDPDWVKEWMTKLVDKIGMKICSGPHTCGPFDMDTIFEDLEQFNPTKVEWKYLDREHDLTEVSKSIH